MSLDVITLEGSGDDIFNIEFLDTDGAMGAHNSFFIKNFSYYPQISAVAIDFKNGTCSWVSSPVIKINIKEESNIKGSIVGR